MLTVNRCGVARSFSELRCARKFRAARYESDRRADLVRWAFAKITALPHRATLVSSVRPFLLRFFRRARCEFLEARIVPKRIEHWVEPEQRRSERHVLSQRAIVRYREQFL